MRSKAVKGRSKIQRFFLNRFFGRKKRGRKKFFCVGLRLRLLSVLPVLLYRRFRKGSGKASMRENGLDTGKLYKQRCIGMLEQPLFGNRVYAQYAAARTLKAGNGFPAPHPGKLGDNAYRGLLRINIDFQHHGLAPAHSHRRINLKAKALIAYIDNPAGRDRFFDAEEALRRQRKGEAQKITVFFGAVDNGTLCLCVVHGLYHKFDVTTICPPGMLLSDRVSSTDSTWLISLSYRPFLSIV